MSMLYITCKDTNKIQNIKHVLKNMHYNTFNAANYYHEPVG